jgi:CheY-like chemotaxis protein
MPQSTERWVGPMATSVPSAPDILVVDDEAPIAQVVAELLRDEGYSVRVVHDGASALLEIAAQRPALLLLDVAMPVMLGDELLRYLRRNGFADLPIVMMTASLRPEIYLAHGADAVLPKPFELDDLLAAVTRYLPPHELARVRG